MRKDKAGRIIFDQGGKSKKVKGKSRKAEIGKRRNKEFSGKRKGE